MLAVLVDVNNILVAQVAGDGRLIAKASEDVLAAAHLRGL
jgi:hypothetical protein